MHWGPTKKHEEAPSRPAPLYFLVPPTASPPHPLLLFCIVAAAVLPPPPRPSKPHKKAGNATAFQHSLSWNAPFPSLSPPSRSPPSKLHGRCPRRRRRGGHCVRLRPGLGLGRPRHDVGAGAHHGLDPGRGAVYVWSGCKGILSGRDASTGGRCGGSSLTDTHRICASVGRWAGLASSISQMRSSARGGSVMPKVLR